jgi:hypothetical protein
LNYITVQLYRVSGIERLVKKIHSGIDRVSIHFHVELALRGDLNFLHKNCRDVRRGVAKFLSARLSVVMRAYVSFEQVAGI